MANTEATAMSSPKTAVPAKTANSAKPKGLLHPPVVDMVCAAVGALNERGGSSLQAIKKYIAGTYMLDADKLATYIKKCIKSAVQSGTLVQTKGHGASGSFRLPYGKSKPASSKKIAAQSTGAKKASSAKKSESAKKSSAVKKATKDAVAKDSATKKSATTKKTKSTESSKSAVTKSPSKVKKVSKAPTTKPKAPKPKKIAAPKTPKKAAAAKK